MRARRDDPERGSLLVMVAVYTAVLLMLGGALLTCAMTEQLIACNQEEEMRLYYIAEAGIEAGVAALACFSIMTAPSAAAWATAATMCASCRHPGFQKVIPTTR